MIAVGILFVVTALLLGAARHLSGCTASQQQVAGDVAAEVGESAGKKCAFAPAMECAWGEGWDAFRTCVASQALPCLFEHVVELGVGLAPVALDPVRDTFAVRYAGPVVRTAAVTEAAACIGTLPEPTVELCGDVALPDCGGWGIVRCVERAAVGAAVAVRQEGRRRTQDLREPLGRHDRDDRRVEPR